MKYRAEIDGLRALAVLPVILFHAGFEWFSGGFVGVDVFFVISGYLITTIIISEMAEGKFSIVNFYERRARRILPALFFVMAACLPFAWLWLSPSDLKDFGQSLAALSTFSSNILFWQESGYFDTAAELKPLLHTWSLAVEEQYYIVFPIFLMLTWRLGIKWVLIILSVVFLLSLGIAQWGAYYKPFATFFLLPTRGWELLIGVFAAFYLKHNTHLKSHFLNQALSLLGFGMIVYSIIAFDETTPFPSLYALVPTIGTGLLILCAAPKTYVHKLLSLKFLVGIGLVSYSAYLWHQPLLSFARYRYVDFLPTTVLLCLCVLSLLLAWFSWRFIEKPFRNSKMISRRQVFRLSLASAMLFCCMGAILHFTDGWLNSYQPKEKKVYEVFFDPSVYVYKRHREIRLKSFNLDNNNHKVLIIGDSHSEDLVNAVFEARLNESIDFSSFYIPVRCGVLFVEEKSDREQKNFNCVTWRNFEDKFFQLLSEADEVWIASDWRILDAQYMDASLKNLSSLNERVTVFGRKGFGDISAAAYRAYESERWQRDYRRKHEIEDSRRLNAEISKVVKANGMRYVDTQGLICPSDEQCSNFHTENLISHDGSHLTPFGAQLLGERLKILLASESLKNN